MRLYISRIIAYAAFALFVVTIVCFGIYKEYGTFGAENIFLIISLFLSFFSAVAVSISALNERMEIRLLAKACSIFVILSCMYILSDIF